jgi:NADH dehydrogenase
MTRFSPVIPVIGAETQFQPVFVDDLAQAAVKGVLSQAASGIYEIGGPEVASLRDLVKEMLTVIQRRRLVLAVPFWMARIIARVFGLVRFVSAGLVKGPVSSDQVRMLGHDNVVSEGARSLADLGIEATSVITVLPEYLWPYRPSGQYAGIKRSLKNLKA